MRAILIGLALLGCKGPTQRLDPSQTKSPPLSVDVNVGADAFAELERLCREDAGRLWGVPLCGPVLIVDPATRHVVANQPDAQAQLRPDRHVYVGELAKEVLIGNTAVSWAGVRWTMVTWPLPSARRELGRLLVHEAFHRVQGQVGLPNAESPDNRHLDAEEGRTWLILEWRALRAALSSSGQDQRLAISDALTFRAQRRALFPRGSDHENALETDEGMAEYTGVALAARSFERAEAVKVLDELQRTASFVRSFAYASGPAYGVLLDEHLSGWRRALKPGDDLGGLLAKAIGVAMPQPSESAGQRASERYQGEQVRRAERERARLTLERHARARARYIEGPVLVLPTRNRQMEFDPNGLFPLGDQGTEYVPLRLRDRWGVLAATGGAFIHAHSRSVTVPAPAADRALRGDGWTLELAPGWRLVAGPRSGDVTVIEESGSALK